MHTRTNTQMNTHTRMRLWGSWERLSQGWAWHSRNKTLSFDYFKPNDSPRSDTHFNLAWIIATKSPLWLHKHILITGHLVKMGYTRTPPHLPTSAALCTIRLASLKPNLIHYQFTSTEVVWTAREIQFHFRVILIYELVSPSLVCCYEPGKHPQ